MSGVGHPKGKRPRSRKAPDVTEDDPYQWISDKKYTCSCCSAVSRWVRPWRWFGNIDASAEDRIIICSDECQSIYEEENGKLIERDPLVVKADLVPAAFNVVCPCCERETEVQDWDQGAPGYFSFDAETMNGPFVQCKCGALIEPQGIRTLPLDESSYERQATP